MGNIKILVVDDDMIVLNSCKRVLEAEYFEVHYVSCANKALKLMESDGFDLLLIDVKMPEHDGMFLIQKVKEKWSEIPIVVMSGYPTSETIANGFKLGATSFIAKPFTPDELLKSVRETLKKE